MVKVRRTSLYFEDTANKGFKISIGRLSDCGLLNEELYSYFVR